VLIINESIYLANIIKKNNKNKNIVFFSTKGFLYNYISKNNNIEKIPKNKNEIIFLENIENQDIIIATDLDPAGDVISTEILSIIIKKNNNIKKLIIPFEKINKENITEEFIKKNTTDEIDVGIAQTYINNKENFKKIKIKKLECISSLMDN
jgi:DNA topoisomerase IA